MHARDPYLRADARRSSRHVVVEVGGVQVAETRRPVLLDETGLITRLRPLADVRHELLDALGDVHGVPVRRGAATTGRCARAPAQRRGLALRRSAARVSAVAGHLASGRSATTRCCASTARCCRARWRARRRRARPAAVARAPRHAAAREHARRAGGRIAARPRAAEQPRRGPARRRHGPGPRARRRPPAVAVLARTFWGQARKLRA